MVAGEPDRRLGLLPHDARHTRFRNSCNLASIYRVTESGSLEVLDALEAFFGQIHCAAQEAGLESLIETDLSFSQFRSILILSQAAEPLPIHELAEKLRLSVAATGRNVERLVKEGLVGRLEDELDRRIKRISLSSAGRDLIGAFQRHRRAQALTFIKALEPADRERLLGALLPIIDRYPAAPDHHRITGQTHQHQEQYA